jgi:hypothetical protein
MTKWLGLEDAIMRFDELNKVSSIYQRWFYLLLDLFIYKYGIHSANLLWGCIQLF